VLHQLRVLSRRSDVHGVMLELPLPPALRDHYHEIWGAIAPHKDVDGLHPVNLGRLVDLASGHPSHLTNGPLGACAIA
jgi:methylenetetrahydrofolate dehydrogenase (NADP+) / methenyltetrahydrofolate cyclohydrolase